MKYFTREKVNGGPITDIKKAVARTAEATGVSSRTINRICKEGKDTEADYGTVIFAETAKYLHPEGE